MTAEKRYELVWGCTFDRQENGLFEGNRQILSESELDEFYGVDAFQACRRWSEKKIQRIGKKHDDS